ncbi:MAG: VWA domain-containing protein [Acidobacteriota bacterium]|nr:MAG: VWA domain-containing protein [Acidobacteriota bacterium]
MIRIIPALITVLAAASFAFSQDPVGTPPPLVVNDDKVLEIESRLVVVPVSVVDSNGDPVQGLKAEDFSISERNRSQQITEVSAAEKVPLEIAILFDVSASTDAMFRFEQETAAKFLRDVLRPIDRATIFTIGERPVLVQERNDAQVSFRTISELYPTKQNTAFFDTVSAAALYLRLNAPAKSRKVILVISDGEDNSSEGVRMGSRRIMAELDRQLNSLTTEKISSIRTEGRNKVRIAEQAKTVQRLQDADTVFYSINPAGSSYRLNKISVQGQDNMDRFANDTGGVAFLPKFLPIDLKSEYQSKANLETNKKTLEVIFTQLANELQAQYLVQYYSDGEYDPNEYIELDVNVRTPGESRIRARRGYFVKGQ